MTGLTDRLFGWRDRLVADGRFQRWAAAFPLTRGIARAQSRDMFDLCAGFVYSQVLAACVELDLFARLAKAPRTIEQLAPELSLSIAATERLLKAATSLRLCASSGPRRYRLGMLGAALLGNPGVVSMIAHHKLVYADLADPVALLRGERGETALSQFWPYATGGHAPAGDTVAPYSALMSASQSLIVEDILEAYPFDAHKTVMDVGGGDGMFLISVARHVPAINLVLFDLPPVAARAQVRFESEHLSGRAKAVGGDAYVDELPRGADLITLIRVLHDHDDDAVLKILKGVRAAMAPGGTLLIAEPMAGIKGAEPVGDAYFGFYLLAMGSGRARTPTELTAMLAQAGFGDIRPLRTRRPLMTGAISARWNI